MSEPMLRSLYISHGGGPLPLLGDPAHAELVRTLQGLAKTIPRPEAIIVVSAHWEADVATVTTSAAPGLLYDYYGFPPESYRIDYPAPGAPHLAERICEVLRAEGIPADGDGVRAFDHGLFVPLKLMYPAADIPCVQLSLLSSLDATAHLDLGRALSGLAAATGESLLLLGSGSSFHNLQAFFDGRDANMYSHNRAFEHWLDETLSLATLTESERLHRLEHWELAPHGRYCHPREEHLLPLHVCYGAMRRPAEQRFGFTMLGMQGSCYLWQVD